MWSATGTDCDDYVGDFWDPTHQCMNFSSSPYCYGDDLCDDSGYSYDCDWDNDRYSCAPGDLSGKFGTMPNSSSPFVVVENGTNTLIPRTDDMMGRMMSFYCNDGGNITHLACAPIYNLDTTTTTTTEDAWLSTAGFDGDDSFDGDDTATTTEDSWVSTAGFDGDDSYGNGVVARSVVVAVVASLFAMMF